MEKFIEVVAAAQGLEQTPPASTGISAVEELVNQFEAHEDQEGEFLQHYRKMAEESNNSLIRYLLEVIIADEERHRGMVHAMVSTLKGNLYWTKPMGRLEGYGELDKAQGKEELLKVTSDFIRHEKEGIKQYKKLMKEAKSYYGGLFVLFLNLMIRDSEKHAEILGFLRDVLKEA